MKVRSQEGESRAMRVGLVIGHLLQLVVARRAGGRTFASHTLEWRGGVFVVSFIARYSWAMMGSSYMCIIGEMHIASHTGKLC